ncbi:MAG: threonine/serine exporter family protein [Candidatus Ancillula sp.]|jgi:uncharacterized membrane protein YjjP (DUF1212 family)|nr:threonine/serine exporter family protein [Candidatus Ancillula sp.]
MHTREFDNLHQDTLYEKSEVVLRAGLLALSSGMGAYRVKRVMSRIANALGISNQAHVTLTEINSTCSNHHTYCTKVATLQNVGVNSDRISKIGQLTLNLRRKTIKHSIKCITDELISIEEAPLLYSTTSTGIFAGIACFSFAFLLGGNFAEMVLAFLGAFFGQIVRRLMLVRHMNQFVTTVVAVFVALFAYSIASLIGLEFGLIEVRDISGYIASLLFVIPGFPLATGGLDIAKLDFSSGIQRVCYALVIICCATATGSSFAQVLGMSPIPTTFSLHGFSNEQDIIKLALVLLFSFIGVLGFALIFNSTHKVALTSALIGAFANTFRIVLATLGITAFISTTIAAMFVGILAAVLVKWFDFTRITLSVPAIVIMVPGSYLFYGSYEALTGNLMLSWQNEAQAFLRLLALPVGLSIARFLTDKKWRVDK